MRPAEPARLERRALVIDDHEPFRALVAALFERAGWSAYECASVDQALAVLDSERFDLVVTDYDVGSATGLDLLHHVRWRDVLLPFVVMSAALPRDGAEDALQHDAFVLDKRALCDELPALLAAMG